MRVCTPATKILPYVFVFPSDNVCEFRASNAPRSDTRNGRSFAYVSWEGIAVCEHYDKYSNCTDVRCRRAKVRASQASNDQCHPTNIPKLSRFSREVSPCCKSCSQQAIKNILWKMAPICRHCRRLDTLLRFQPTMLSHYPMYCDHAKANDNNEHVPSGERFSGATDIAPSPRARCSCFCADWWPSVLLGNGGVVCCICAAATPRYTLGIPSIE